MPATFAGWLVLERAGQPLGRAGGGGAGAAAGWTKADGTDVAVELPAEFLATTRNRSVLPTSAATAV
jgi:hypothetical protein